MRLSYIQKGFASKDINNAIHCIWYCVNVGGNRTFDESEIKWLKRIPCTWQMLIWTENLTRMILSEPAISSTAWPATALFPAAISCPQPARAPERLHWSDRLPAEDPVSYCHVRPLPEPYSRYPVPCRYPLFRMAPSTIQTPASLLISSWTSQSPITIVLHWSNTFVNWSDSVRGFLILR